MFEAIFQKIGAVILSVGISVAGWFGVSPEQTFTPGATNYIPDTVAAFRTTLQLSIDADDTSMTLVSASYNNGNSTLASSTYAFTIDPGDEDNQEFVIADCTGTTCTNMTRGLDFLSGTTTVSGLAKAHRKGAVVEITDGPVLLIHNRLLQGIGSFPNTLSYSSNVAISTSSNQIPHSNYLQSNYVDRFSTQNIFGVKTLIDNLIIASTTATSTIAATTTVAYTCGSYSASTVLCPKSYVDSVAVAGASDANTTTKGIVEEATEAEINAGTAAGGTSARLFVNPSTLKTSNVVAGNPAFFVATSSASDYLAVGPIAVTSGDVLMIWGMSGVVGDGSGTIGVKGATGTTTINNFSSSDGNTGSNSSMNGQGYWLATGTDNLYVELAFGTSHATTSLMVQHFNR